MVTKLARQHAGVLARNLDPEPLAMAVVRVGEAFLYGDHLGNGVPNVDDLIKIYRLILLPGQTRSTSKRDASNLQPVIEEQLLFLDSPLKPAAETSIAAIAAYSTTPSKYSISLPVRSERITGK